MFNFTFYNPVKIVFGKGSIAKLPELLPSSGKIMLLYGGGSIKKNGVYDQVIAGLKGFSTIEFSGIEPNPEYETCMKAVELARKENVDFLLAVGGGSVADAVKFIAAAIPFKGDPWTLLSDRLPITKAVPLGVIITLPATGSEMNGNSVISRRAIDQKRDIASPALYPQFSILDPETTYTLPTRQVINGIVDAFVHTTEQYLTYPVDAPLQDRQAEAILLTLIEEGPKVLKNPKDYDSRANIMWAATNALNYLIACGVPQDWVTHMIGHEITAFFGLDHAQTLAIVLPALWTHQKELKKEKLIQYGRRVWNLSGTDDEIADAAITRTREFFESLGQPTRLSAYKIPVAETKKVVDALAARHFVGGERKNITSKEVQEILTLAE